MHSTVLARTDARRWLLVAVALVFALLLLHPGRASAELPSCNDPSDCPPYEESTSATLTLQTPAGIRVTSSLSALDCTGGCTKKDTYTRTCFPGDGCEDYAYNEYSLGVVNPPAGWGPAWTGCDGVFSGRCNLTLDTNHTVTLGWTDIGAPTVGFTPPAKVGQGTVFGATGSDNSGAWAYDWTVDGAALTEHGPTISLGVRAEGDHTVAVRTRDGAGNVSGTITKTIKLDRSTHITVPQPPAFTNAATLPVNYTTDDDVTAANRKCSVNGGAAVTCAPTFSPVDAASSDGTYAYTVAVTDDVGNTATSPARSFVLDRTAPVVAFTDGPTEGQLVTTRSATLTFGVTDTNVDAGSVKCALDGATLPCTSATTLALSNLKDGQHVVTITGRDKAGNAGSKERRFTVKTDTGTTTPPPGGTTNPPGGTTNPPGGTTNPPVLGAIAAGASWDYAAARTYTILSKFKIKAIPKGAKVVVKCKGGGCPKKITVKGSGTKAVKALTHRRLKVGTVIQVWVTKPGYIGRVLRIVIRARKAPASTPLCLPVGATKPGSCG